MNITLNIQVKNKQGVWLKIVGFFKAMDCQLEIKSTIEQGDQRFITVAVVGQKSFTTDDMHGLLNLSEDVLSVKKEGDDESLISKAVDNPITDAKDNISEENI